MDIPANSWRSEKKYQVNDIVRVGNFALPLEEGTVTPLATDGGEQIVEENESIIVIEITDEANLRNSQEVQIGGQFSIDPSLNYSIRSMVRKGSEKSQTVDPYKTLITEKLEDGIYIVDPDTSIGVGVGLKFYDSSGGRLGVADLRKTHRLMGSSELNENEYYNTQLDIESKF